MCSLIHLSREHPFTAVEFDVESGTAVRSGDNVHRRLLLFRGRGEEVRNYHDDYRNHHARGDYFDDEKGKAHFVCLLCVFLDV
jgi:hypothetical protein